MKRLKFLSALAALTLSLSACGGGGGTATGAAPNDGNNTTTDTTISGQASKGPITGQIGIYALKSDGSKGNLLKTGTIVNGRYAVNIGKYAGPVLLEASGGYTDEATGASLTISADAPLRAALSAASGDVTAAVTPLTEIAVQKTAVLTAAAIDAGNKLVSDVFKVDIVNTQPVAPTAAAVGSASQAQKDYTLALAVLSQLSAGSGQNLPATLASMAAGIDYSGMNNDTVKSFQTAITAFMTNGNNKTGITDPSATSLVAINGGTTSRYTFSLEGVTGSNAVNAVYFNVAIPTGLQVRTNDASGVTSPGVVTASATVAAAHPLIVSRYSASEGILTFGLATGTSIGPSDLVTLVCDTVPGWPVPSAAAFGISNISAFDVNVTPIDGVNISVRGN